MGWAFGGVIKLVDENDHEYSIVVSRVNRIVSLENGFYQMLKPVPKNELKL